MHQRTINFLIGIIVVLFIAVYFDLPSNPGLHVSLGPINIQKDVAIQQGLDLQGGTEAVLQVQPAFIHTHSASQVQQGLQENQVIIGQRLAQGLGVTQPQISTYGNNGLLVDIPGAFNASIGQLLQTGKMLFLDTGAQAFQPGAQIPISYTTTASDIIIQGADLQSAQAGLNTNPNDIAHQGKPLVTFTVKSGPAQKLLAYTTKAAQVYNTTTNSGDHLTVVLDTTVVTSPVVQQAFGQNGEITGIGTLQDAQNIAIQLNYGSLPVPMQQVALHHVGPTLGQDSVHRSLIAGVIGLVIVLMFMVIYYRLPGLLADLALIIYALVNLAIYKFVPITLTLAGIAGFILSIGMAVDANILIFERMKEELRQGKALTTCIENGFDRAWPSIRDSNISTMITCVILFFFGSTFGASIIQGFATTLFIGVLISMLTAIIVTRTFLRLLVSSNAATNPRMYGLPKELAEGLRQS